MFVGLSAAFLKRYIPLILQFFLKMPLIYFDPNKLLGLLDQLEKISDELRIPVSR